MDVKEVEQFLFEIQTYSEDVNQEVYLSTRDMRFKVCIDIFNTNLSQHSFCWFRKTQNFENRDVIGISSLGYIDVTTISALQLIHPDHIYFYLQLIKSLHHLWRQSKQGESVLNFTYFLNIPMRDVENNYWLIRQKIVPCQINDESQVLDCLIWNDILRPYYGEPVNIKAFSHQGNRMTKIEERIKEHANYYKLLPFTPSQLIVLKAYLQKPRSSAIEIGEYLSLEDSTIFTHNRNILSRSRQKYGRNFKHIKQLVDFFMRHEIFGNIRS